MNQGLDSPDRRVPRNVITYQVASRGRVDRHRASRRVARRGTRARRPSTTVAWVLEDPSGVCSESPSAMAGALVGGWGFDYSSSSADADSSAASTWPAILSALRRARRASRPVSSPTALRMASATAVAFTTEVSAR